MNYKEPLSDQVLIFIGAIGPGVLIGLMYDVIFSFFRGLSEKRAVIIAADLCFFVWATLLSFFYMVIFNSGIVRLNMIIAQLLGAVAFHYTLGKRLSGTIGLVAKTVAGAAGLMLKPAVILIGKIWTIYLKVKGKILNRYKMMRKSKKTEKK